MVEATNKGERAYIDRITYFCAKVIGSEAYWRDKRGELTSWIQGHISLGNGAPNLWMTFSCAEFYWKDVFRLLKDRESIAKGHPVSDEYVKTNYINLLNSYTLVVQEFFRFRFEAWMDLVGKDLYGIAHYYAKYEFAPGRGEVHVHLLAILKRSMFFQMVNELEEESEDMTKKADYLGTYAEQQFGMTAIHPDGETGGMEHINPSYTKRKELRENSACKRNYTDIPLEERDQDSINLMNFCAQHCKCSDYCLREKKGKTGKQNRCVKKI